MLEGPAPTLSPTPETGGDDLSEDNLESRCKGGRSKNSKGRTTRRRVRQLMEAMANEMENKDRSMQQVRVLETPVIDTHSC